MTGKEIIDLINKRGLGDFELKFIFTDGYNIFPNVRSFKIESIADIGYSDKVLLLEGEEL